jgi:3-oxoacyl-[acyl-carrier-protein] synthase-1
VSTACASGAGALIKGAELIQAGICDAVIAGGADIASETVLLGFDSLGAVSPGICKPFSKNRDGITLGEGAAFFLLSGEAVPSGEGFPRRGIRLLGAGESADAFHMTAPREDGAGAAAAMEKALAAGGIKPGEVGYVNAHGTGTPLNDRMEAHALASVFFKAGPGPLVSSTKPITGHTLGAAGALELALCWMALVYSQAPPHCWDGVYDEELPRLHFAARRGGPPEPDPETPARDNLKVCMSNSFAFGGCNTSLIIGKGED